MKLCLVMARVRIVPGDKVRYTPNFADPYRDKLAEVVKTIDAADDKLEDGASGTRYWLKVVFIEDKKEKTLPASRFILEEQRQNIVHAS